MKYPFSLAFWLLLMIVLFYAVIIFALIADYSAMIVSVVALSMSFYIVETALNAHKNQQENATQKENNRTDAD